jgi:hypothetical protein
MLPLIPIGVGLLALGAYWRRKKNRGVMTTERVKIFNAAISGAIKEPQGLEKLANSFSGEGLYEQAKLLRQRAALKRLPLPIKEARREIWRHAIQSKNKAGILNLAAAYDREGCTGSAMRLREIASGLPENIPVPDPPDDGMSEPITEPDIEIPVEIDDTNPPEESAAPSGDT